MEWNISNLDALFDLMNKHQISSLKINDLQVVKSVFSPPKKSEIDTLKQMDRERTIAEQMDIATNEQIEAWSISGGKI